MKIKSTKMTKIIISVTAILLVLILLFFLQPIQYVFSEYYLSKYAKTSDIEYAYKAYKFAEYSNPHYKWALRNYTTSAEALLDSGKLDELAQNDNTFKNATDSGISPELSLKEGYIYYSLFYTDNDEFDRVFSKYYGEHSDIKERTAIVSSAGYMIAQQTQDKSEQRAYYYKITGAFENLIAKTEDKKMLFQYYSDLLMFCTLSKDDEGFEKYSEQSKEKLKQQ